MVGVTGSNTISRTSCSSALKLASPVMLQLLPPSVDLYTLPAPPNNTMLTFVGCISTENTYSNCMFFVMQTQLRPLSVLFQTPAVAVPQNNVLGLEADFSIPYTCAAPQA